MMNLPTIVLTAFAILLPIVAPSPTPNENGLAARAEDACVVKNMNIAYCNNCVPSGEGPPDCVQNWYTHLGASGQGSCNDKTAPFNNACTTFGSVTTPFGSGTWKKAPGCGGNNSKGTYGATIVPSGGGSAWSCSCVNSKAQYTVDCGSEFACSQVWFCSCSKC